MRLNGFDQELLDEDVTVGITYKELIVKGPKVTERYPLMELEGLASIRRGIGFTYGGVYFKVVVPHEYQSCMIRYRTIRRIIMGEKYI